jgi:hypothetical protein
MKLLTILAVILGVACMAMFYSGNAHAEDALGECIAACKAPSGVLNPDGKNCNSMTGQAQVGCNFECWCLCTAACDLGGGASPQDMLAEYSEDASVIVGKAIPAGDFHVLAGIQNLQKLFVKIIGSYPGQTEATITLDQALFKIPMSKILISRAPSGCMEGDFDIGEYLLVDTNNVEYDPTVQADKDIIFTDLPTATEEAVEVFGERVYGIDLVPNSNACTLAPGYCDATKVPVTGPGDVCFEEIAFPAPGLNQIDCSLCDPDSCVDTTDPAWFPHGGYPANSCSTCITANEPGCCVRYVDIIEVGEECFLPDNTPIDCSLVSTTGNLDNEDDWGMKACELGDTWEEIGGVSTQVTFLSDCPIDQLKGASDELTDWRASVSAAITAATVSLTRQLFDEGRVVDENHVPYTYQETVECGYDQNINF